jgi:uncharacterized membrane protein YraQ (UPF0718 family)
MDAAGYLIELVFTPLHLAPTGARHASVGEDGIRWNYTTWLNIVFLLLAAVLLWRFFTSGGRQMLAMMGGSPDAMADHHGGTHTTAEGALTDPAALTPESPRIGDAHRHG